MEKAPANLELILHYFADFSPLQIQQLTALEAVYQEWNDKINTISRKDIGSLYERHVLHSLSIAAAFEFSKGAEVLDIGTGGGFPGIPLAIFFPDVQFHLVDSIGKKIKVVEAVKEATGVLNVSTQHGRAEEIRNRKFDIAVSRAVAPLKELWTWSRPLLKAAPPAARSSTRHARSTVTSQKSSGESSSPPVSGEPTGLLIARGLICLKGGDITAEIADSGCRPLLMEIHEIFPLDWFREKYLLYIPKS
jgi:16S rRNA (guanine527-N7)-methyltransferase